MLFVHCRAHRRLRANTSGKIKRSSGCYYPHRYSLQLFCTATAGCSCTPRNLNRNRFWEKHFCWHDSILGRRDRDGEEQTTSLDKTESSSKVFMCGVSNQKGPSNQITMFERTRESAWVDAVTRRAANVVFSEFRGWLAGKEVRWAMKKESRRGTAGCRRRLDEDQHKRRCASTGIVWQELGNRSANKDDGSM